MASSEKTNIPSLCGIRASIVASLVSAVDVNEPLVRCAGELCFGWGQDVLPVVFGQVGDGKLSNLSCRSLYGVGDSGGYTSFYIRCSFVPPVFEAIAQWLLGFQGQR